MYVESLRYNIASKYLYINSLNNESQNDQLVATRLSAGKLLSAHSRVVSSALVTI